MVSVGVLSGQDLIDFNVLLVLCSTLENFWHHFSLQDLLNLNPLQTLALPVSFSGYFHTKILTLD